MKEKRAALLLKLRNVVWDARRRIEGDRFEKKRGSMVNDHCGIISLVDHEMSVDDFINHFAGLKYKDTLPEIDCILQYEEEGQLCSFHWMEDDKYQIHMRIFWCRTSELARAKRYVSISCHREIRADYDPLAHVRGVELTPFCDFVVDFARRKA